MLIRTLWKMWDDDAVELLTAMDDAVIDIAGWQAWDEACDVVRKRYDITDGDTREVLVEISKAAITDAFKVPTVSATSVKPALSEERA